MSVWSRPVRLSDKAGAGSAESLEVSEVSIHQEAVVEAAPEQVYAVLTDGEKFASATGMPARISDHEGTTFMLFGGRIEGRQVELVNGARVVQAWRFGDEHPDTWGAGVYSILRFTLIPEGDATKLVIDHAGIPSEWQEHIASGYPTFYQEPLARYFAASRGS
jgi:activator of HSP90 ATPase